MSNLSFFEELKNKNLQSIEAQEFLKAKGTLSAKAANLPDSVTEKDSLIAKIAFTKNATELEDVTKQLQKIEASLPKADAEIIAPASAKPAVGPEFFKAFGLFLEQHSTPTPAPQVAHAA